MLSVRSVNPRRWLVPKKSSRPRVWANAWLTRMVSTLLCRSGHRYEREKVLMPNPRNKIFDIYLARRDGQPYIVKHVPPTIFQQSLEHIREFPLTRRLRLHIDCNEEEQTLVFEYFHDDLLSLMRKLPNLPLNARKHILRETAEAVKELHDKDWVHLDIKPDNIMVDWSYDEHNQVKIDKIALGDLDCSLKLRGDILLRLPDPHRIGNVMWRSPEGQTGKGLGKPSDIFSLGLVCLYVITGAEMMRLDVEELKETGTPPEMEVLGRCIMFFGPLPDALVKHTNDQKWEGLLRDLCRILPDDPETHFDQWGELDFPALDRDTKRMLFRMLNLDPGSRALAHEILEDPWWTRVEVINE